MSFIKCTVAEGFGRCSGISRSIASAYKNINNYTYMLGKVVRSSTVTRDLVAKGMPLIQSLDQVPDDIKATIVIPTHGVPECVIKDIGQLDYTVLDNTCPRVRRVQDIIASASNQGMDIIVVGSQEYPQVQGLIGWAKTNVTLIQDLNSAMRIIPTITFSSKGVCLVASTEYDPEKYKEIYTYCRFMIPNLIFHNTSCNENEIAKNKVSKLIKKLGSDVILIIGDKESPSNRALYAFAMDYSRHVCLIESPAALDLPALLDADHICMIANHSVTATAMDNILDEMQSFCNNALIPFEFDRFALNKYPIFDDCLNIEGGVP